MIAYRLVMLVCVLAALSGCDEAGSGTAIVHNDLYLPPRAEVGDVVGALRIQPATSEATSWEILSGDTDNLFRINTGGELLVTRRPADITTPLSDSYDLGVRARYAQTEVTDQVSVLTRITLSGASDSVSFTFAVPAARAAFFEVEQLNCGAANGVCCAVNVDTPEAYLDFARLIPTTVDTSLIRYAMPPLAVASTVTLQIEAAAGQMCVAYAPSRVLAATDANIMRTVGAPGALGVQQNLGVMRLAERDYLIDISRRSTGLAPSAAILTQHYYRNTADLPRPFSSLLYAPPGSPNALPTTTVDAHKNSQIVFDYLQDVLSLDSFDDRGAAMVAWTDFDSPQADTPLGSCRSGEILRLGSSFNAFWNGSYVTFTPRVGMRALRPFSAALDVVAHEWGHGVSNALIGGSGLIYARESGALSEAYSDWLGVAIERSVEVANPDWTVGEAAYPPQDSGLRSLADPTRFNHPDTYKGTHWNGTSDNPSVVCNVFCNDNCGVHTNSGVGNKMFYLLAAGGTHNGAVVAGIGITKAIQIATHAVNSYWSANTNYANARATMIMAATDIFSATEQAQVRLAWDAVRVTGN